jgi:ferric-dicitrate binding protein FerR (iron transport regulator)
MILLVKVALNVFAALAGIAAALFWYKASVAEVPENMDPQNGEASAVVLSDDDHSWDLIRTTTLQSKWNKRAALAASLSAALQAMEIPFFYLN